jgi:hypothetical protein
MGWSGNCPQWSPKARHRRTDIEKGSCFSRGGQKACGAAGSKRWFNRLMTKPSGCAPQQFFGSDGPLKK